MVDRTSGHPTIEVIQANVTGATAPGTAAASSTLVGGVYNSAAPSLTNGQQASIQFDTNGNLRASLIAVTYTGVDGVSNALLGAPVGSNSVSGARPLATSGLVFNGTTWDRVKKSSAVARLASAANSINATVVKASAGDVFKITGFNAGAITYLNLYNKATTPAPATDNALLMTRFYLPANASFTFSLDDLYFSSGISYALVLNNSETDATAVAAAAVLGLNITYQ